MITISQEAKSGLKRVRGARKRRRLKYIAILPSLVTLMNGLCGFTAIIFASRGQGITWSPHLLPKINMSFFALAGYMIFMGMIADVLDGHVARISKSVSSFGAQLDSLCDVISFGVAPAFLMLKLVEVHVQSENYRYVQFFGRLVYLIAIIYAMCALIRLARFNVENKEDDASHLSFAGLPSPPAAGLIVSIVIFHQDFLPKVIEWTNGAFGVLEPAIIWMLPVITLTAGLLMVTRIPYPHVMNRLLRGKKSFSTFLLVVFALLMVIWSIQLAMVLGFFIFMLYGIVRWPFAYRRASADMRGLARTSRENSPT
ncbi:MAG: phosphatidylcholine/phosphatidylserine synthase [Treponema sp.]|jgi:CDP-diacylglycerol--serine O-phosphatidyltransferase|nr:phosphatidylcholine/phosphatidylserine synthase [Treponema sp.]